jgi:predicted RNA-binding protein (TIGR00451 family)
MLKKPIQIGKKKDLGRKGSLKVLECLVGRAKEADSSNDSLIQVTPVNTPEVLVYLRKSDNEPIAFQKDDNPRLYPSLYSLWQDGISLPSVFVGSSVSSFILTGVDLMLPGVIRRSTSSSQDFREGDLVQLLVPGCVYPFAIGFAEISSSDPASLPEGHKGKAVRVIHYFGDGLWRLGSKYIPSGFDFDRITASSAPLPPPTVPVVPEPLADSPSVSLDEMDQIAYISFLDVANGASESDLPMNASSLYSKMQFASKSLSSSSTSFRKKNNLPLCEFKLDLRKSSHKNVKDFVQFLSEKKSLVSSKLIRGELVILSLNVRHPDVVQYTRPVDLNPTETDGGTLISIKHYYSLNPAWSRLLNSENKLFTEDPKTLIDLSTNYIRSSGSEVSLPQGNGIFNAPSVSKQEFATRFKNDMVKHYSLSSELPPQIHRGDLPVVEVVVKKVKGGGGRKLATIISGMSKYFLDQNEISKLLASAFSVSCSVQGDDELYIQGNLKTRVVEFLSNVIGVPKTAIR